MRFNSKKTKSMVISRYRTYAPGYVDLTLGSTNLKEAAKSLRILGVTCVLVLTFEIHLHEVVSKAARNSGDRALSRKVILLFTCAQELFQCIRFVQPRVLHPHVDIVYGVSFGLA